MVPSFQTLVGASPQTNFTIPNGLPRAGFSLRVRVNGVEVAFSRTNATTIALRQPARVRSIVDFFEVPEAGSVGGVWSGNLDFPSIAAARTQALTVSLPEAAVGDIVSLGLPSNVPVGVIYTGFVSAAGVVTVRATNVTAAAIDPPSGAFRVSVSKD